MAPGSLRWQQGLATWHQGNWDNKRTWPHDTRAAGIASGSGHKHQGVWDGTRAWIQDQAQCPASWHKGGCDGIKAWPHATRVAEMATDG